MKIMMTCTLSYGFSRRGRSSLHRMPLLLLFLFQILLVLLVFLSSSLAFDELTVAREIKMPEIGSLIVIETLDISFFNKGKKSLLKFPLTVPATRAARISHVVAYNDRPKNFIGVSADTPLEIHYPDTKAEELLQKPHVFTITLRAPLEPGTTGRITVMMALNGTVRPYPVEIDMDTEQNLLFEGVLGLGLTQKVKNFSCKIRLSENLRAIKYTDIKGFSESKSGAVIYGPFDHDPVKKEVEVYFRADKVGQAVSNWHREVWVRKNGATIEYDERVHLYHRGAAIKGHFNRFHYMVNERSKNTNRINNFIILTPLEARDFFFRDDIGNVSTSALLEQGKEKIFALIPRFPIYGGWNYNWNHGYEVPGSLHISRAGKAGAKANTYTIEIPFVGGVVPLAIDDLDLHIVLPEGALVTGVKVNYYGQELEMKEANNGDSKDVHSLAKNEYIVWRKYYYFDTIGRPVVAVSRHNWIVVNDMGAQPTIKVTFELRTASFVLKPLVFTFAFLMFFGLLLVWTLRSDSKRYKQIACTKAEAAANRHCLCSSATAGTGGQKANQKKKKVSKKC